jgi:hypothetical protein
MNIRERLMSRASVAVMAAFAPKPEGAADTSKVGQAENVDDVAAGGGDDSGDDMGLSAEEQAQFDAMAKGRDPAAKDDIEPGGAAADAGEGAGADDDGQGDPPADGDDEPPAAAADGEPAPAGQKKPKTISYGRHQRDLAKVQEQLAAAQNETAKEREARVRLDERTRQLLEAIQMRPAAAAAAAPEADADPEPNADDDPIGHAQWKIRSLEKTVTELKNGRQQEQQATAAEQEERQIYDAYAGSLESAAATDPTFADAFVHLRETRYRELGFIYAGVDINDKAAVDAALTPEEQVNLSRNIQRTFHNEQMLVAREALKARKSPATIVKNLALARNFVPKAAAPDGGNGAAPPPAPRGKAPPAAPAAPAAAEPSVKDQLQSIREGTELSRSLSDAGGSPGDGITPERIANMSDDEWNDFFESMPKNKLDAMMGKPART